jgi:hypothetical protein
VPEHVCFGSLADIGEACQGCPLYPQEADMLIVGINVCSVPKADFDLGVKVETGRGERKPGFPE